MANDNIRYDIAIIGTGPAGISAAITAKVRNKNIILFGTSKVSEKVKKAHKILNYPGLLEVTGEAFYEKLYEHLKMLDIEVTDKKITTVYSMGDYFALQSGSDMYEAKTVILATGVVNSRELPGENEWLGRGVSYCATCDGTFYRDKRVAVIGYNAETFEEVKYLAEIAKEVLYFRIYKNEQDELMNIESAKNIKIITEIPRSLRGEKTNRIIVTDNGEYSVDGIFILRDSIAPDKLVPGLRTDGTHIEVNLNMETSIEGCFACGDIAGRPYQYVKSAGQGNVAALSAVAYLAHM
ncbi:NAD(P)/FAD-dependent oxidoreductase [Falcatimonas sp. MSJ-15]|uniref:NAD(P)/FAD-dependent oxidoreductase n=1 Tax=Falcatimonas sp. MSJ-15 TaxID=2841515 RepID=UPI001C10ED2E|nr:NAD(P)/FAD-dependent oxidoreductase [Falcatimonas sp. MSJ-15]MBU5470363.1 NAD(P)/FAD-dependent oxidoreductase [Falcatimonas sp. MSJ-15]